jgi:hypothetical protein
MLAGRRRNMTEHARGGHPAHLYKRRKRSAAARAKQRRRGGAAARRRGGASPCRAAAPPPPALAPLRGSALPSPAGAARGSPCQRGGAQRGRQGGLSGQRRRCGAELGRGWGGGTARPATCLKLSAMFPTFFCPSFIICTPNKSIWNVYSRSLKREERKVNTK